MKGSGHVLRRHDNGTRRSIGKRKPQPRARGAARIEADRLYLRPLTESDCTEWYATSLNDPQIARFLETWHTPQTLDGIRKFVATVNAKDEEFLFGMFLLADDRHIGNIKVGPIHPYHHVGDVSLWIGDKSCWGSGYATEAIVAISRYAFDVLGARKLSASMYELNHRAYRAFIKAGYRDEGRRRAHYVFEGQRSDVLLTGLTPDDL
jgi:RimJ/RimL family protein N-acetyltransferase